MITNAKQNQESKSGAIPNDSCRVNNLKIFILAIITLAPFSTQINTAAAAESIYDEILTPTSGTIDRELIDFKTARKNNIVGVKYDLIEIRDELNQLIANPDPLVETITEEAAVVEAKLEKKPAQTIIPPTPKTAKISTKTITPTVKKNKAIATVKPAVTTSLKLQAKKAKTETINTIVSIKKIRAPYDKHGDAGNLLDHETTQWSCVHDTNSGLMWEVKSNDDSMRNSNNLYSWFDSDAKTSHGLADGGRCQGDTACDTKAYVLAMNKQNYCGHNDWQLPTREQMNTLVDLKNEDQTVKINKKYFPETVPSWYWTASEHTNNKKFAWYVLFRNGVALNDLKERPKHIRLVRNHIQTISKNSYQ